MKYTKNIYDTTFSIFELMVLGLPIIPSQIEIRAGILVAYIALYKCNIPQFYTTWKRKIKRSQYEEVHDENDVDIENNFTTEDSCYQFNDTTKTSDKTTMTDTFLSFPSNYNYDMDLDADLHNYNVLT